MRFWKKWVIASKKDWYNEKCLKTEIKSFEGKINTSFHSDKVPKECSQCICVSMILIDSVYKIGKNYPQVFLEECKYVAQEKKIPEYITGNTNF